MKSNRSLRRRLLCAAPLLFSVLASSAPALAGDPAAAQSLFEEGKRYMAQGQYAVACGKLEESQKLDPAIGTQFQLATCYQETGRIASAWASFLEVAQQARASGQASRERVARSRASALEQRLPKLVIVARAVESVPGVEIKRDGVEVGKGQWGSAVPVDPGERRVTVRAPGKKPWETTVVAQEGKSASVEIPALQSVAPPPAPAPVAAPQAPTAREVAPEPVITVPAETRTEPPARVENRGSGQRVAGVVIAGVGLVGVAIGSVYGLDAKDKRDQSNAHCNGNRCDVAGADLRERAIRSGNVSTIAFGAGGAALLGGVVLFLTAPRGTSTTGSTARTTIEPMLGLGASGIRVSGAF